MMISKQWLIILLAATTWACAPAHGQSTAPKTAAASSAEETAFGRPGDPKQVTRTIAVDMKDTMRFTPDKLAIHRGDTIRFVIKNTGKAKHEFVLGSMAELKSHSEQMKKHPGMAHDEPYMVHVSPGKTGTVVWQFTRDGEFHFGCLLPGHFEAGMVGNIKVTKR